MALVPHLEFMRIKVTRVFLMLKLPYTKNNVGLFNIDFLTYPTKMGGWSYPCISRSGQQVPCSSPILYPKVLPKFERWKEDVPKVSPHFENMLRYTTSLQVFHKEGSNPWFLPLFEGLYT
jgi:hypothetical protein